MTTKIQAAAQQTLRPNQDRNTNTKLREQIKQLQAETEKLKQELNYWRNLAQYYFYNA